MYRYVTTSFTDVLTLALGTLAGFVRVYSKHNGYHDRDHDRYYSEGQSEGHNYRSDRSSIDVHL